MRIFAAIQKLFKVQDENAAGAIDKIAEDSKDPVLRGKNAIMDSKKEVDLFKAKIQELIKTTNLRKGDATLAQADVTKYEGLAKVAATAQNAEEVAVMLTEKNKAQQKLDRLNAEIQANEKVIAKLKEQAGDTWEKIIDAEAELPVLQAQLSSNKLRQDIAKSASLFGAEGSGVAALDDLHKAVNEASAGADAWEEMAEDGKSSAKKIEEKYTKEASAAAISDEVTKLMAEHAPKQ